MVLVDSRLPDSWTTEPGSRRCLASAADPPH